MQRWPAGKGKAKATRVALLLNKIWAAFNCSRSCVASSGVANKLKIAAFVNFAVNFYTLTLFIFYSCFLLLSLPLPLSISLLLFILFTISLSAFASAAWTHKGRTTFHFSLLLFSRNFCCSIWIAKQRCRKGIGVIVVADKLCQNLEFLPHIWAVCRYLLKFAFKTKECIPFEFPGLIFA